MKADMPYGVVPSNSCFCWGYNGKMIDLPFPSNRISISCIALQLLGLYNVIILLELVLVGLWEIIMTICYMMA